VVNSEQIEMRILFFIDCLTSGGKERRLTELMKGLKSNTKIDFELVLMSRDIHYKEVFDLDVKLHYIIRKTKKDISVFYKFYVLSRNYKPDIIHCWDSMTAIYSVPICKLLQIKLVNGMVVDAPLRQNITNKHWLRAKLTFPFSKIIIGNSKAGLKAYSAPKNRSFYIYNGFNFRRNDNIASNKTMREHLDVNTKYIIGMVATYSKNKDYETFISAAHLLLHKREDITFLAIGNETDSAVLKKLINYESIQYFRLLGKKSGIESFINAMDICVLSTFSEGISNSIMEYMSLEKPVIATSGGGTNEIVIDRETGFLIPPSNPRELAEKIEILLNNEQLRKKMGLNGKDRIQKVFSIDTMVHKYIHYYESIVSSY
jgi:glycosyltransferase involved in cell wall biosynthesis